MENAGVWNLKIRQIPFINNEFTKATSIVKFATIHGAAFNPFYESIRIGWRKTGVIQRILKHCNTSLHGRLYHRAGKGGTGSGTETKNRKTKTG